MSDGFERSEFDEKENNLNMEDVKNGNCRNDDVRDGSKEETEKGFQENEKSDQAQGLAACGEECEDGSQGQEAGEEETHDEKKVQETEEKISDASDESSEDTSDRTGGEQSSWSYTPPSAEQKEDREKAKKRRRRRSIGIGLTAVIVAIAIVVTAFGGFIGMLAVDALVWLGKTVGELGDIKIEYNVTDGGDRSEESESVDAPATKYPDLDIIINEQVISEGSVDEITIADVVREMGDTVVEISTATYDRYGRLLATGTGSGVIIDSDGYIVTNNHVVEGATMIRVEVSDRGRFDASVIGTDPSNDIALIRINASGLPAAVLGSSESLVVGQEVIAIGYPLGSGMTVTDGIISALNRQVNIDGVTMTLLQTNAAINPGNSGGALFDMAGRLVGIVNAKQVDTDIEGLGFAIPIDSARRSVENLISGS